MILLLFSLCHFISASFAENFQSSIFDVTHHEGQWVLRFKNGRTGFLSSDKSLPSEYNPQLIFDVELDEQLKIRNLIPKQESSVSRKDESSIIDLQDDEYRPSILETQALATSLFNSLNSTYQRQSECSDRAHVWSWELLNRQKIRTEKIFVFFTASYINRYRFKWWFHVAPLVTVKNKEDNKKYVFDYVFLDSPKTIREWTNLFVFSKKECKFTTRFSEYDHNPQTEDCYLMTSPMYLWTPADLMDQENYQRIKSNFSMPDIQSAYQKAF